jgi:hypothetical protein
MATNQVFMYDLFLEAIADFDENPDMQHYTELELLTDIIHNFKNSNDVAKNKYHPDDMNKCLSLEDDILERLDRIRKLKAFW